MCSDSDAPFVSYTVNKPIGDSPKRKPLPPSSRFSSPRLGSRASTRTDTRLARSAHNTLVTVNHLRLAEEMRSDEELVRLQEIPSFFPVMQAAPGKFIPRAGWSRQVPSSCRLLKVSSLLMQVAYGKFPLVISIQATGEASSPPN